MKIGTTSAPDQGATGICIHGHSRSSGDNRRQTVGRALARRNSRPGDCLCRPERPRLSGCDPGPRRCAPIAGNWHWITSRKERPLPITSAKVDSRIRRYGFQHCAIAAHRVPRRRSGGRPDRGYFVPATATGPRRARRAARAPLPARSSITTPPPFRSPIRSASIAVASSCSSPRASTSIFSSRRKEWSRVSASH